MPFEVHTGARPGRPRLLLVIHAVLLAGVLGVAWMQVRAAHGLGPEQRVGDTPLLVRVPHGWRQDPRNPQRFVLMTEGRARQAFREFERRIQVEYVRLPGFQAPDELLRLREPDGSGDVVQVRRTRLGPYDALELHQTVPIAIRQRRLRGEMITRFTCLPRGHLVKVVYEPLVDLRPADIEIMDEVCQSLRIDDPTLAGPPDDYLAAAGLHLPREPGWLVVGADFAEVPGVYVGGSSADGPAWAIGILRTWLADGRKPRDLLLDFAGQKWLALDIDARLEERRRPDGATVAHLRHPAFGEDSEPIPAAWVVAQSPDQAVMLFVHASPAHAAEAEAAAARLASEIRMAPLEAWPALADAEAAGRRLVEDLRKRGPAPRWGRETVELTYRNVQRDETVVVSRSAIQRDPSRGYEGLQWRRIGRSREDRVVWQTDGRAAAYLWQSDFFYGIRAVQITEQRDAADGPVSRRVWIEERERQRWTFTPGDRFVPPPVEPIIAGWVARGEVAAALVEVSSTLGPGTHAELLRRLPADGQFPRVLVQEDFWPLGGVLAFDDGLGETQYEIYPTAEYRRVK